MDNPHGTDWKEVIKARRAFFIYFMSTYYSIWLHFPAPNKYSIIRLILRIGYFYNLCADWKKVDINLQKLFIQSV